MQPFPQSPELLRAARRIIWFEEAAVSLANPLRLMTYALRYATAEDMQLLLDHVGEDGLRKTLDNIPPGIVDARSWSYWNNRVGRFPAPDMPRRNLDLAR
ncbi:MAG: hypothetical protein KJ587_06785 [Alphaproteobacteria bacterium]|nr:hypothetical protein [Alphaproteobacteria bacterium]